MTNIRGVKYPLKITNGTLNLVEDVALRKSHIFSVLQTEPGERVMRPGYGTPDFLFEGVQDVGVIAQLTRQSLQTQIPDLEFGVNGSINDDGGVALSVNWAIEGLPQPTLNFELVS